MYSIVRCLNPANYHPARITKAEKDLKFPVPVRDIY